MFYYPPNKSYIIEGNPFVVDDVQYPANWLNLSTPEEKEALGLEEVITVGAPKDDKYYWVSETLDKAVKTITNTPKDLDQCKALAVSSINATAYSLLASNDWMVVKSTETGTPIAQEWSDYRANVRTVANSAKDSVNACADVDAISSISIDWPESPGKSK